jgi:hypothetical protein
MHTLKTEIMDLDIEIEYSLFAPEPQNGIFEPELDWWGIKKINGKYMQWGKYPIKFHNKIEEDEEIFSQLYSEMLSHAKNYDEWK